MVSWSLWVWLVGLGCKSMESVPTATLLKGTTTRIGRDAAETTNTDRSVDLLVSEEECNGVLMDRARDMVSCIPHVDRASGEVRLSFQVLLKNGDPLPSTLEEKNIQVHHILSQENDKDAIGFQVEDGDKMELHLVPHEEIDANQIYILMIDGSASMLKDMSADKPGVRRIDEVRKALLSKGVQNAFFPKGQGRTAVVMFQFTSGAPVPMGGQITLLKDEKEYVAFVKKNLEPGRGFTHLYSAVEHAVGPVLSQEGEVRKWVSLEGGTPTVIVLTDGFNNEDPSDKCKTNVSRLNNTLKDLKTRLAAPELGTTPSVYTVGLGRELRKDYKVPRDKREVSPQELCGDHADRIINNDLENESVRGISVIDNVSLAWLAYHGGGRSFTKQSSEGLGEAFQAAAAKRYRWFEIRYRVSPEFLRRSFRVRVGLQDLEGTRSSVMFYPSAWLDAPPGVVMSDGWTRPASYRATLSVLLSGLGLLAVLSYVGASWFNVSRVLFGRMRPPRPPRTGR